MNRVYWALKGGGFVDLSRTNFMVAADPWPSYQERLENGDCEE